MQIKQKTNEKVLIFACALGTIGLAAGGILSMLYGIQENDWGFLIVYLIVVIPGLSVVILALRQLFRLLDKQEKSHE
jgi:uncharacterized membrane protein YeaQ/YmgE (transglycosylase-associated protein family)